MVTKHLQYVVISYKWCYHKQTCIRVGGGGVLSPKSYVDVPAGPWKSDYLYTNLLPNFPPISIPFSKEKHPIWIKLGVFYNNLPKIHPIYVIWAPPSLMKTPPIAIPNFAKKCPKRQAHIRIPCRCENPPRLASYVHFALKVHNQQLQDLVYEIVHV